jgi:uncharacterized membrane protein YdjX (TVP38/TMEM64 family)
MYFLFKFRIKFFFFQCGKRCISNPENNRRCQNSRQCSLQIQQTSSIYHHDCIFSHIYFVSETTKKFFKYLCLLFSLQTFAIPGSIFLSILAGFLYPFPLALFLVCLCSSLGASFCYLLSQLFGRHLLLKYFHDRITLWQKRVQAHSDSLVWFIIFLRITPILPNWFINVCSPILDVPLGPFFAGTFAGVALPSILFIQAGKTLHQLTSASDVFSWRSIVMLGLCAILSLLPIRFKDKIQKFFKKQS